MKSWSLRYRLSLQMLITVVCLISLFGISAYFALNHAAERYFQTRLQHDAEMLLGALRFDDEHIYLADGVNQPIFREPFSGHYYQIEIHVSKLNRTQLISQSLDNNTLEHPFLEFSKSHIQQEGHVQQQNNASQENSNFQFFWLNFLQDQHLYVLAHTENRTIQNLKGVTVSILVAEDFAPVEQAFGWALFILLIIFIAIALLWNSILQGLLKRHLRPFEQIEIQLQELTEQQRENLTPSPMQELEPLVQEINHLGVRTRERLERARLATGNLSHALKTPLSIIINRLDLPLSAQGEQEQRECQQQLQVMQGLIERELKRARIAGLMSRGQALDMATLFEQLKMTMNKLHPQRQIHLIAPTQLDFPGDREDMMELFGNLLDNACKWAQSQVMIQLEVISTSNKIKSLRVCICDDGPGVASEELPRLQHPGERLDESTSGHGLGLAIVADIIKQYDGQCNFSNNTSCLDNHSDKTGEGGLQVCVQIPYPSNP